MSSENNQVWDVFQNREHATKYNSLQPGWCAEMYGYVFAAAELRVKHTILPNLQHRDVDGKLTWEEADKRRTSSTSVFRIICGGVLK